MTGEHETSDRSSPPQPWFLVILVAAVMTAVAGLMLLVQPAQPPSACLQTATAKAGASVPSYNVCLPGE